MSQPETVQGSASLHVLSGSGVLVLGPFGLAFSTAMCAATICVAIFAWDLEASSSSASAFLYFMMVVVTVSTYAFVFSSAFVSSSASTVIGIASSVIVMLVDLGLEIGDGGNECLHLCHHGLVLV